MSCEVIVHLYRERVVKSSKYIALGNTISILGLEYLLATVWYNNQNQALVQTIKSSSGTALTCTNLNVIHRKDLQSNSQ